MNFLARFHLKTVRYTCQSEFGSSTGNSKNSAIHLKEIEDWILPIAAARLTEWIPENEKQEIVNLIRQRLNEE
jgi:hypothetical protein